MFRKGSPQRRIIMAGVKAFLVGFGTYVVAQLNAGASIEDVNAVKSIAIGAVSAGALAAWKAWDLIVESKGG
jgi:hypothetical protein